MIPRPLAERRSGGLPRRTRTAPPSRERSRRRRTDPPTARFIWEKLEHFIEHVERGRPILHVAAMRALEDARRASEPEDRLVARALRRGEDAAADRTRRAAMTRAEIAKVRTEYEEIAARTAPAFRCVLEALIAQCRADEEKARE